MDRSKHDGLLPEAVPEECWPEPLPLASLAPPLAAGDAAPHGDRVARLIRTIEAEIIPRLVVAHRPLDDGRGDPADPGAPGGPPHPGEVEAFAQLMLGNDDDAVDAVLRGLRERGVGVETIYLELLAPAARRLGWMWDEDLCDFTDVTVGVGRLQQLMRELSPALGREVDVPADGRRVLLAAAQQEQHTFGLAMVGEFFRRAGWDVVGAAGGAGDAVALARSEWFDVVGLSLGHHKRTGWLRETIAALRQHSRNRQVGVMVGGPLFVVDGLSAAAVGADVVAREGARAPELAEQLLVRRARRV